MRQAHSFVVVSLELSPDQFHPTVAASLTRKTLLSVFNSHRISITMRSFLVQFLLLACSSSPTWALFRACDDEDPCGTPLWRFNRFPMCSDSRSTECVLFPRFRLTQGWECGGCGITLESGFQVEYKFNGKIKPEVPWTYSGALAAATNSFSAQYTFTQADRPEALADYADHTITVDESTVSDVLKDDKFKVSFLTSVYVKNSTEIDDVSGLASDYATYIETSLAATFEAEYISQLIQEIPEAFNIADAELKEVK